MSSAPPILSRPPRRRAYQIAALRALAQWRPVGEPRDDTDGHRCFFLLWRRQGGKSTLLADAALYEMIRHPGRLVTYASASLLLGREIILKEAELLRHTLTAGASGSRTNRLEAGPRGRRWRSGSTLATDDFAELFEQQRLELRFTAPSGRVSRTVVIAPNPATARGWSGTVLLDEFGFVRELADLWEAVEPILSSRPDFRLLGATTPPADDTHFSHELTHPPPGLAFSVNPEGNWYRTARGQWVHRTDIFDACAAGLIPYDLATGRPLTPEEHRAGAPDLDAWNRNYGIEHTRTGAAAVSSEALASAQQRGRGQARFLRLDRPEDLEEACGWLVGCLGSGAVGLGWDVATTDRDTSNPNALAVAEQVGAGHVARIIALWKTRDPQAGIKRVQAIVSAIEARPAGGRARRLCIDASNERYFAQEVTRQLGPKVPVLSWFAGARVAGPHAHEPSMLAKTVASCRLAKALNDNQITLPDDSYVRDDFRRIRSDRGVWTSRTGPNGEHGDTFDAVKLALESLAGSAGAVESLKGFSWGAPLARV